MPRSVLRTPTRLASSLLSCLTGRASEGGFPGYTFMDTGVQGGTAVAISPRQGPEDEVLFFVRVDDVAATLSRAEELGGTIVQPVQQVPGVSFGVLADAHGHKIGVAAN